MWVQLEPEQQTQALQSFGVVAHVGTDLEAGAAIETVVEVEFAEVGWGFAEVWWGFAERRAGVGVGHAAQDWAELHPER